MHLPAVFGSWGTPPDGPAWGAFVLAIVVLAASRDRAGGRLATGPFLGMAAFASALLSLGYATFYLRDGPRIVDATSYFLQARALSEGHFAWHVPEPSASFRGRFLYAHDDAVAGIFPPGYPLLLSLGFAVGAPLVVGPALAAAIVLATWALARELARETKLDARAQETVARVAALLSVACAALRYHTAETMAHGACALAFALALGAALRARREGLPWFFLPAGLALGFVVATRFASAVALGAVVGWLALKADKRGSAIVACALGVVPGLVLLAVAESAATGHALRAAQSAYYAASDGPPGCFRYGFGKGIGCLVEHGDFVRARMSGAAAPSFGLLAALGVTARRLRMHAEDIANFEPLALLVFVPIARGAWRTRGVRACTALVGCIVLAYAPFYFDGDYPGGGARFFADVLPVEHALLALGVAAALAPAETAAFSVRTAAPLLALASLGFALHASFDHEQLRKRDGGYPMFDPEVFAERSLGSTSKDPAAQLVFFETDHGFDLAHDPDVADRAARALGRGQKPSGTIVARLHGDDHDRLLYERLGRPSAWTYRYVPESPKNAVLASRGRPITSGELAIWNPSPAWRSGAESWRFEAEAEWPPFAQVGTAWAEPMWATDSCASPSGSGRALALRGPGAGSVVIALPVPRAGSWRIVPRFLVDKAATTIPMDVLAPDGSVLAHWDQGAARTDTGAGPRLCVDGPSRDFTVASDRELRLSLGGPLDATHLVALDRVTMTPTTR
jgi:hypothetical protein